MSNGIKVYCDANNITRFKLFQEAWEWRNRMKMTPSGNTAIMQQLNTSPPPAWVLDYMRHKNSPQRVLPMQALPR
jgi:hypothetical protein